MTRNIIQDLNKNLCLRLVNIPPIDGRVIKINRSVFNTYYIIPWGSKIQFHLVIKAISDIKGIHTHLHTSLSHRQCSICIPHPPYPKSVNGRSYHLLRDSYQPWLEEEDKQSLKGRKMTLYGYYDRHSRKWKWCRKNKISKTGLQIFKRAEGVTSLVFDCHNPISTGSVHKNASQ